MAFGRWPLLGFSQMALAALFHSWVALDNEVSYSGDNVSVVFKAVDGCASRLKMAVFLGRRWLFF